MADEKPKTEAAETPAPAKGGGIGAWLPLIITVVLMPVLAFAMTQFLLLPQLQKGLGVKPAAAATEAKSKPGKEGTADTKHESVPMSKLLVNVAGTMGARYLLVSLSVVGTGEDFKAKMTDRDAQLRDMACGTLANKTLADLEKPDARNLIRNELITGFNTILGDSVVTDIYLTEFAIQ
jgi:flagellar basal body-associated protein FliL